MKILALNSFEKSTVAALYENFDLLWIENQEYGEAELSEFPDVMSQEGFRVDKLRELLESRGIKPNLIQAFVATGGLLHSVTGGTYQITMEMLQDLQSCKYGESPANLGALLAIRMAALAGTRSAFIVDPPVVDEMPPSAHITGLPEIGRRSGFHALNQRAVAQREAANMGKPIKECNFIVCHLDDEISIGAHKNGVVVEVNDIRAGTGPMSARRAGSLPPVPLVDLCFSGKYTQDELKSLLMEGGGFKAHLDTDDIGEVVRRVRSGDRKAILTLEAFMFQIIKAVGGCAAILEGHVDAIILTGGMVKNEYVIGRLTESINWISRVVAYPAEHETLSLVEGVIRVMRGAEEAKNYA
ncbi:MAG: butyrate kinase [Synergistaceae bacterium]|nr:butyrate kinase [Synergistaceae bacterium]